MIKLEGTDFQIAVWKELLKIPAGSTKTYKEIGKFHQLSNYFRIETFLTIGFMSAI